MQIVRQRPVIAEAMQMPENPLPGQATEVYNWVEGYIGAAESFDDEGVSMDPETGLMLIASKRMTQRGFELTTEMVHPGDYVVRSGGGQIRVYDSTRFKNTFESVHDRSVW